MPLERADEKPEDSEFRFVVLGYPGLGEFLTWDEAVAKAWEVTPPGETRVEVTIAQKGVIRVRTEDPDEPGWIVTGFTPSIRHSVARYDDDWLVITHCNTGVKSGEWETWSADIDGPLAECQGCLLARRSKADVSAPGASVLDIDHSAKTVHLVERSHLSFVQLRCGRITRRSQLVLVTGPGPDMGCGVCLDIDTDPPAKPLSW